MNHSFLSDIVNGSVTSTVCVCGERADAVLHVSEFWTGAGPVVNTAVHLPRRGIDTPQSALSLVRPQCMG